MRRETLDEEGGPGLKDGRPINLSPSFMTCHSPSPPASRHSQLSLPPALPPSLTALTPPWSHPAGPSLTTSYYLLLSILHPLSVTTVCFISFSLSTILPQASTFAYISLFTSSTSCTLQSSSIFLSFPISYYRLIFLSHHSSLASAFQERMVWRLGDEAGGS